MNRTSVIILQHRGERFHRFNTARIVHRALDRCDLLVEHMATLAEKFAALQLSDRVGLLYPGDDAKLLTEVSLEDQPDQLVVIDGTWNHAKALMRQIPRLRTLPRYSLAPTSPSRYRIRREPNELALSTLEATVAALKTIEPATEGLDALVGVFDRMVDEQLKNPKSNWRRNEKRGRASTNSPRALLGDLSHVVIGYGEQERGNQEGLTKPAMIYWTAKRLVSGETFRCAIQSPSFNDAEFMARLQLPQSETNAAVSVENFRAKWQAYLRPDDVVAVYQQSTATLLKNIDATFKPTIVMKSISIGGRRQCGTLEDVLATHGIEIPPQTSSRAAHRLECAAALIDRLRR